jgi:hypothetical protein
MEDQLDEPQRNPACVTCAEPILPRTGRYRRGSTSVHATCEWATLPPMRPTPEEAQVPGHEARGSA